MRESLGSLLKGSPVISGEKRRKKKALRSKSPINRPRASVSPMSRSRKKRRVDYEAPVFGLSTNAKTMTVESKRQHRESDLTSPLSSFSKQVVLETLEKNVRTPHKDRA